MLTIDGKQYRNLEEQVRKNKEDIQSIIEASAILNAFGIKVVGQVDTSDKLPNPADYPGEYGDAYLVGTATPYDYYIFTRPNDTHPTAYWLNIGKFPLVGPQGETGPQGPQGPKGDGSKWYAGTQNPTIVAEVNDQYLNTTDGSVFSYSNVGWTRIGNIRGPQGVQGVQGIQGIQGNIGPVGPKGERGDVGGIVNIRGLVDNVNQLPTPTSLQNLSIAYLVGTNKELYIQIGETPETATWNNMGILNVATYVTVDGQYVNVLEMNQYQNKIRFLQLTGTSGTLTSEQINLLRSDNTNYIIVDNELYNCNDLQDTNGYLVYTHTCADASNNVNIKTLSITLTNNNWSIQTTPVQPKIPVANTNEAVQFAEDERQKTLNLFNPRNNNRTNSLASITTIVEDNLIRVSSDGVYGNTRVQYLALDLTNYVGKTLYFKCKYSTSSTNDTKVNFWFANSVNDFSTLITTTDIKTGNGNFNTLFEVPSDLSNGKYLLIMFYSSVNVVAEGYVDFTDILLSTEDIAYIAYNGAIVHEKELIEKSMTLIDKIYVPDENSSQLRFDNLPGQYNYKLIVIGSATTASDGSIKINDTDLKSITLSTNSDDTNVVNTFGDTALIRVDNRFRIDAEISVTDTYTGTPIVMEINNVSSTSDTKIYSRKTSSTILGAGGIGINSITVDIGTSKFYRGTEAFLYKLGGTKWKRY